MDREFVAGLRFNTNLCKVFQPPVDRAGNFWIGMNSIPETSPKARFIVVHQCRKSAPQGLFVNFLQKSFECEDSRFVQALQNCHEEILFMWSNKTIEDSSFERLPESVGLVVEPSAFLMMMVILENVYEPFFDSSGLELMYRQESADQPIRQAKRLVIGHQANGKHVLLSGLKNWISDSYCSAHCLSQKKSTPAFDVVALEVHTRSLGTSVQIDVRYKSGEINDQKKDEEKLAIDDLGESDKELETGNKTKLSFPVDSDQHPSSDSPDKSSFNPSSSFLFPSVPSPQLSAPSAQFPELFLLPRSFGFAHEFFFDTPLLGKTTLELDRIQTIRKVLPNPYRILSNDDDILLRCEYSTTSLNLPTFGGISHEAELCFAILTYIEHIEINRNDKFSKQNFFRELSSCMSHPADRNLAIALQFGLEKYETENYPNKSRLRRTKRQGGKMKDQRPDRIRRWKRQAAKSVNNNGDIFLSQRIKRNPQTDPKISTVLDAIDYFDRFNNVDQRMSANVDILNGQHVSSCSNQEEGVFLSILIDNSANFDRQNVTYTPRSFNFATHEFFVSTKSGASNLQIVTSAILSSLLTFLFL